MQVKIGIHKIAKLYFSYPKSLDGIREPQPPKWDWIEEQLTPSFWNNVKNKIKEKFNA